MSPAAEQAPATNRPGRAAFAWFGALVVLCYAPVIWALVRQWYNDEDMGHGFFVPILAGYIAWQKREELSRLKISPNWWGLAVVGYAALQLYIALVLTIIGIVLFLCGAAWLRVLAFPLAILFFMVPIPTIIYNNITFPLQLLASRVAAQALTLLDVPVLRSGNVLELPRQSLSVVDACSGIRSLLSLTFLALVYGYRPHSHRGERQPGHPQRRAERNQPRPGRRALPYGFRLGDLHGGARHPDRISLRPQLELRGRPWQTLAGFPSGPAGTCSP
jgi:exosortase